MPAAPTPNAPTPAAALPAIRRRRDRAKQLLQVNGPRIAAFAATLGTLIYNIVDATCQ